MAISMLLRKPRPHYRTMGTGFVHYFYNTGNGRGFIVMDATWPLASLIYLNHFRVGRHGGCEALRLLLLGL